VPPQNVLARISQFFGQKEKQMKTAPVTQWHTILIIYASERDALCFVSRPF
jgi:hypothetical protein